LELDRLGRKELGARLRCETEHFRQIDDAVAADTPAEVVLQQDLEGGPTRADFENVECLFTG
jgi:hypothetical protein